MVFSCATAGVAEERPDRSIPGLAKNVPHGHLDAREGVGRLQQVHAVILDLRGNPGDIGRALSSCFPSTESRTGRHTLMKIDAVDFFYLSMPVVTTEADGSQDALLVRVSAGGLVGWGECEASPLVSIAAFVTPMSHGVCRPVGASVLGQSIDEPGRHCAHCCGC